MIDQYHIARKKLQAGIMISLIAFALSGCAGLEQEMEELEPVIESVQAEEQEEVEAYRAEKIEVTEEAKEVKELPVEKANPSIPRNKATTSSSIVNVDINGEGEYRAFVGSLEEYRDRSILILNMQKTDTVIYLDEILAYHNFNSLTISSGGVISVRNMDEFKEDSLHELELHHIYAIEENIIDAMPALRKVEIRLNGDYSGVFPAKELVHNTNCPNIAMIWDDDKKYEERLEELAEWEEISASMSEKDSYLKGLYVWNEEEYNYTSYEFCEEETEQASAAFICIKDRGSYGEKYFGVLEVPVESVEVDWSGGRRMTRDDLNFDGYYDLVFMGRNWFSGDSYVQCIGFLWNENEQKYEWNATVPKHYGRADADRKRIIDCYTSSLQDEYFIYEYHDGIFTEKRLEVSFPMEGGQVIWHYYEDDELIGRVESTYSEDAKLYYITYEENGNVTEKVMEEAEYDNRYVSYSDLGEEYFPEFDFYWKG